MADNSEMTPELATKIVILLAKGWRIVDEERLWMGYHFWMTDQEQLNRISIGRILAWPGDPIKNET